MIGLRNTSALALLAAALMPFSTLPCRGQSLSTYTIRTVAGNGTIGFSGDSGAATSAQLSNPAGVALDSGGNLYITDQLNFRIRRVSGGNISTVAGNGSAGFVGDNGQATSAQMNYPFGVAVDSSGNYYFTDASANLIRKVTLSSGVIAAIAGNVAYGAAGSFGDGGKATEAGLRQPTGVAVDTAGNVYIADSANNRIRMVKTDGVISTVVGDGLEGSLGDGGPGTSARVRRPRGVAVDAAGNLYIADTGNDRVRKLATDGTITTVAGNGVSGFSGDNGPATGAALDGPRGVAVDAAGNLYIADYYNSRIRKVTADGAIYTVAGNGRFGYYGDGDRATNAALFFPSSVAVDAAGNVYIADTQNNVVRMLEPVAGPLDLPVIVSEGVTVAPAFGGGSAIAPGSIVEIRGSNFAGRARAWTNADFGDQTAPTMLDGTTVTIGGQAAALSLVAPDLIVALVPEGVAPGVQTLRVTTPAGAGDPYLVTVTAAQPALLAPPSFAAGGRQYVSAILSDGVTYAAPAGAVPETASRPVRAGETITLYGTGFGPVVPDLPLGRKAAENHLLGTPLQIFFGDTPATIAYAGLAKDQVGVYQFDVVAPAASAAGAVPVTFTLGETAGTQRLYIEMEP